MNNIKVFCQVPSSKPLISFKVTRDLIYYTNEQAINKHDLRESQAHNPILVQLLGGDERFPAISQCCPESLLPDLPKLSAAVEPGI